MSEEFLETEEVEIEIEQAQEEFLDELDEDCKEFYLDPSLDTSDSVTENFTQTDNAKRKRQCYEYDPVLYNDIVKITPDEFSHLLNLISKDDIIKRNVSTIPIDIQMRVVLYRLCAFGDKATLPKVRDVFKPIHDEAVRRSTKRIFSAILNLKEEYLCWPDEEERQKIKTLMSATLPGCIGYIGTTEIKLIEGSPYIYLSQSGESSVKMQAICDNNLSIRHATVGFPACLNSMQILANTSVARCPERLFSDSEWIAGGSVYSQSRYVMSPISQSGDPERPSEAVTKFNEYFLQFRNNIDVCFELLKERFGSLNGLRFRLGEETSRKQCNEWVLVCCILHNILMKFNGQDDTYEACAEMPTIDIEFSSIEEREEVLFHFVRELHE